MVAWLRIQHGGGGYKHDWYLLPRVICHRRLGCRSSKGAVGVSLLEAPRSASEGGVGVSLLEAPRSASEGGVGWGKGPYSTVLAGWSGGTLEMPV